MEESDMKETSIKTVKDTEFNGSFPIIEGVNITIRTGEKSGDL